MKNAEKTYSFPDFGKVPPQSINVEEAVLGAIMVDSSCIEDVAEILKPEMFYKESHQKIFAAAHTLYRKNQYADLVTLTTFLRDSGELESCGGPLAITNLTRSIVTTQQVVQHSLIIKTSYIQREMIRIGTELQNRGFDPMIDHGDLIEYAEKELYNLGDVAMSKDPIKLNTLISRVLDSVQQKEKIGNRIIGIPSGIGGLDRITLGWQPGDLIIIAARPSMGKSALAVQFARVAAQMNNPTLIFSLEMTDSQIGERYISGDTSHDAYSLKTGYNVNWAILEKCLDKCRDTPLWIDDSAHMSIYEFRSKVRRAKKRNKIKLVICDYLNLFSGDSDKDNMSEKYGSISKMFKQVAKECGVAVIALAQLNRSPEMRAIQFPKLSDLRNSGEIEQDADMVIFPVRYKMIGETDEGLRDRARISVEKNRNGRTDMVEVKVSDDCLRWGIEEEPAFSPVDFTESVSQKGTPF